MGRLNAALLLLAFALGCSSGDGDPNGSDDPPIAIQKSAKRGLAYNLLQPSDLEVLKGGVSWWYNWYYQTTAPIGYHDDYQMDFLPMLWGHNGSTDYERTRDFILDHPEVQYLLVLNEPNLTDQANMAPSVAARDWLKYEALLDELSAAGRNVQLVGPAITWGTLSGYEDPIAWMDAFYESYRANNGGRDPRIDYLAFHWYDYGLAAQLNRLAKYGKQIWVTEMANWNPQIDSYAKQSAQMIDMVEICEERDDVFRYAWFIGRADSPDSHFTYLVGPEPGTLTELGELYLALPY